MQLKEETVNNTQETSTEFPVERIRLDFPMLQHPLNGKPFIYLDKAATGQKPQVMLYRLMGFYTQEYAIPNEKLTASEIATQAEEDIRQKIAAFLKA